MFSSDNVADILEVHAASLHLQCGRVSVYIQVYVLRKCLGRGSESKIVQRKNQQLQGSQIAWKDYQQLLIRHKIVYLPCCGSSHVKSGDVTVGQGCILEGR
jgi:hypothetical protein